MPIALSGNRRTVSFENNSEDNMPFELNGIACALLVFLSIREFFCKLNPTSWEKWVHENPLFKQASETIFLISKIFKEKIGQVLNSFQDLFVDLRKVLTHLVESGPGMFMSYVFLSQFQSPSVYRREQEIVEIVWEKFPSNLKEAKKFAGNLIKKYDLPKSTKVLFTSDKVIVKWKGEENLDQLRNKYPEAFHKNDWLGSPIQKAKMEFSKDGKISLETVFFGRTGWGGSYNASNFLVQEGTVTLKSNHLDIQIDSVSEKSETAENRKRYNW